jgi:hypothetical protein
MKFLNVFCREVEIEDINALDEKLKKFSLLHALNIPTTKVISIEVIPVDKKVGAVTLKMHNDKTKSIVTVKNKEFIEKDFIDGLVRIRFETCRILNPKAFNELGC